MWKCCYLLSDLVDKVGRLLAHVDQDRRCRGHLPVVVHLPVVQHLYTRHVQGVHGEQRVWGDAARAENMRISYILQSHLR